MKKILTILLVSLAFGGVSAYAEPESATVAQRIESASATPVVKGGVGRIYPDSRTLYFIGVWHACENLYSTDLGGNVVKLTDDSHVSVELPKGFYIVRCSGFGSVKVVVK